MFIPLVDPENHYRYLLTSRVCYYADDCCNALIFGLKRWIKNNNPALWHFVFLLKIASLTSIYNKIDLFAPFLFSFLSAVFGWVVFPPHRSRLMLPVVDAKCSNSSSLVIHIRKFEAWVFSTFVLQWLCMVSFGFTLLFHGFFLILPTLNNPDFPFMFQLVVLWNFLVLTSF